MKRNIFGIIISLFCVASVAVAQPTTQSVKIIDKTNNSRVAAVSAGGAVLVDGSATTQPVSAAALPLPSGAATSANQSTEITSLQLVDNLVLAEDSASATLDSGVQCLAVRASSPGNTSGANGDYEPLQVNAGRLWTSTTIENTTLAVTQSGTWSTRAQDGTGNALTSTGGALDVNILSGASSGTEYTEGATDSTITGSAILWEDAADTLRAVSAAKPLPVSDAGGSLTVDGTVDIGAGTAVIGHVITDTGSTTAVTGTVTVDSELAAGAALADAASATPTTPTLGAVALLMNATTLDRQRAVVNGLNSTGTGIAAAGLVGQLDDVATGTVTENQFSPVRMTATRASHANLRNVAGDETGTSSTPLRVDPTGTTPQPVSGTVAVSGTVTVDSELPAAAALADGASATPTTVTEGAVQLLMNATTVDRARSIIHAQDTTGTGVTAAGMLGELDDTSPTTVTENQFAPVRITAARGQHVNLRSVAGTEIGTSGNPIRTDPTGASSQPVNNATAASLNAQVVGDVANGASDGGNPVKIGGVGKTANPTAVTDGQRVNAMFDKLGKQVTVGALRALKGVQKTTITSSTSETTIVTAIASTFNDVYGLVIANTSATGVSVTIKDATAGTTRFIFYVPANDTRGFTVPVDSAVIQAATNNNWTATCSASVASVEITALYVQNL